MAWCHQATSHYLSQCWPRSLSPYGFTRPQWVNVIHYMDELFNDQKDYNPFVLTHWGRVLHICINKLTIIGSDNGLLPDRCQAIIWTNAEILCIGLLGTNFSEILIEILTFSFKKMRLKVSSAKLWPFCLGLNVGTFDYENMAIFQIKSFKILQCNS